MCVCVCVHVCMWVGVCVRVLVCVPVLERLSVCGWVSVCVRGCVFFTIRPRFFSGEKGQRERVCLQLDRRMDFPFWRPVPIITTY
mmetsp:Transcript_42914/g.71439  ORF Transcript_42914/g.71439 Transcript_42914/m.71439 type:complete len:85 (+) Transcript_42914:228-482(+)